MVKPYLIQIGQINRPLNDYKRLKLSDAVDLEYMGSSEFEFGSKRKSLIDMFCHEKELTLRKVKIEDKYLRVLSYLNEEEFSTYEKDLLYLHKDLICTKEQTYFNKDKISNKYDFWWDIENSVMWSYDKIFMNNLPSILEYSFNYMKLRELCPN